MQASAFLQGRADATKRGDRQMAAFYSYTMTRHDGRRRTRSAIVEENSTFDRTVHEAFDEITGRRQLRRLCPALRSFASNLELSD
jgi:hypothetical protein